MGTIALEMTGEDSSAARMMAKMVRAERKVEKGLKDIRTEAKRAKPAVKSVFPVAGVSKFVTGLVGVGGVLAGLRLIKDEFKEIINLQERAAAKQITLTTARGNLIRNLSGETDVQKIKAIDAAGEISRSTNVPERIVTDALAEGVSASGGNLKAAIDAVRLAAKQFPNSPENISEFAGSLIDLMVPLNTTDPREAKGFLSTIGKLSRVVKSQQQALNFPKAIIGAVSAGATPQEAGALLAALSTASGDKLGASSATGTISFTNQLREFQAGEGAFEKIPASKRPGAGTLGNVIAQIQSDPSLAKRFLDNSSFEQQMKAPIRELLTDIGSKVSLLYVENLKAIPGTKGLIERSKKDIESLNLDKLRNTSTIGQIYDNANEQFLLSDLKSGDASEVRRGLTNTLRNIKGSLTQKQIKFRFEYLSSLGRENPSEVGISILQGQLDLVRDPFTTSTTNIGGSIRTPRDRTEAENRQVVLLETLVEKLTTQNEIMKRMELQRGNGPAFMGPGDDQGGPGEQ